MIAGVNYITLISPSLTSSTAGPAGGAGVAAAAAAAAAAAVPGGTSGTCAESDDDVSADAGRGGGDGRRWTGVGTPTASEIYILNMSFKKARNYRQHASVLLPYVPA